MKRKFFILVILISLLKLTSCKKDSNNDDSNNNTIATLPVVTTSDVTMIKSTSALSGGNVTSNGGSTITARGVCWSTSPTPTTSDSKTADSPGSGNYPSTLSNLTPSTTYYVRAYATNTIGTAYGSEKSFTTNAPLLPVVDFDGNSYPVVEIGTQVWMAENLKSTHFCNGDPIPNDTASSVWSYLFSASYCYYNNNLSNVAIYGNLYNWYAVADSRNICPAGWHVPTDSEWAILESYLGGYSVAGGKMRETGTAHWMAPNTGATNESGFAGLPGGERNAVGGYDEMNEVGLWWTATESDAYGGYSRGLNYSYNYVSRGTVMKKVGFSVRCIKD